MLRSWEIEGQNVSNETHSKLEPIEIQTSAPSDSALLRDWSGVHKKKNQDEIEHEIKGDPLASPGVCSIDSGWSMPHQVFENDNLCIPFHLDASVKIHDGTSKMIEESGPCSSASNELILKDVSSDKGDMDVEACQRTSSVSVDHLTDSHFFLDFVRGVRSNPKPKFKIVFGFSLVFAIICVTVIAIAASFHNNSSGKRTNVSSPIESQGIASAVGTDISSTISMETNSSLRFISDRPTSKPSWISTLPTLSPTTAPTPDRHEKSSSTSTPTAINTLTPSISPTNRFTSSIPTLTPTYTPITSSPTMDCTDSGGTYLTYNDKLRNCTWLDNGYNGAKSDRKDMNCLSSDLGSKCRYTCRLYNGCVEFLLSILNTLPDGNDFSIGNSCEDKPGVYFANNHSPRNCTWIEEDPSTAPIKKSLNCGTPETPRTELGVMCPKSCAGYNGCNRSTRDNIENDSENDDGLSSISDDDGLDDDNIGKKTVFEQESNRSNESNNVLTYSPTFLPSKVTTTYAPTIGNMHSADYSDDNNVYPTDIPTLQPNKMLLTYSPSSISESVSDLTNGPTQISNEQKVFSPPANKCFDKEGEFQTHVGPSNFRQCRWFNRDGDGITIAEKKKLNCRITEIGMNCPASCGCLLHDSGENKVPWEEQEKSYTKCIDPSGVFVTHTEERQHCSWLDKGDSDDARKKELNCGKTEIGVKCICRCPMSGHHPSQNILIQDVSWEYSSNKWDHSSMTIKPSIAGASIHQKSRGNVDTAGEIVTLIPIADTTLSKQKKEENFGVSKELRVAAPDNEIQSLLLFDLTFVSENFETSLGSALLRLYVLFGSASGGISFQKMDNSDWEELGATWDNISGEGTHELIVSFLDSVRPNTWYDVDVTSAVRDAFQNQEQYLSIRIVSDFGDISFASKECNDLSPQLIIDSKTIAPTKIPSYKPADSLSSNPVW